MTACGHVNESINELRSKFQGLCAEDVLLEAWQRFGLSTAMSSSFQTQSVPLLHMVSRVTPGLPIIFVDTGYHFPETLAFRDRLMAAWDLNVRTIRAHASPVTGTNCRDLYRSDSDLCCRIHKVEPFRRVTREQGVWLSGIRWDQTSETPLASRRGGSGRNDPRPSDAVPGTRQTCGPTC